MADQADAPPWLPPDVWAGWLQHRRQTLGVRVQRQPNLWESRPLSSLLSFPLPVLVAAARDLTPTDLDWFLVQVRGRPGGTDAYRKLREALLLARQQQMETTAWVPVSTLRGWSKREPLPLGGPIVLQRRVATTEAVLPAGSSGILLAYAQPQGPDCGKSTPLNPLASWIAEVRCGTRAAALVRFPPGTGAG